MKAWPIEEYIKRELPRPSWAVENLIPAYGISLVFAFPKVGKSILSIQLAYALGTQTQFLGFNVPQAYKTLYVQSDLPEGEWLEQIKKVGLVTNWSTLWKEQGWLYQPADVMELQRLIASEGYSYIIYDALSSISGYTDLDDIQVMGRCLTILRFIAPDVPCVVIHHKRKGSPGIPDRTQVSAAGSYVLSAGASVLLDLTDNTLKVLGRYVKEELQMGRDKETGCWKRKTKQDLYSLS